MGLDRSYRGLRVLDLSENIAGPLACMIFGDLGADVVKVERRMVGDSTRSLPPRQHDNSTVFLTVNRNKRSVELDLASEAGRAAVMAIAKNVDVVVESFRPGVADKLGLGYEDFLSVKPDMIYCSISAFGRGPHGHDRPGYDALVQAFTGIMALTGQPDERPSRAAPSLIDISTGMWAAMSIMAALAARAQGEEGPHKLESTLIDSGMFMMCHQIVGLLGADFHPERLGSAAPSTAPYKEYTTADGSIMIAAATDRLFRRTCAVLEADHLADDPRYRTVDDRVAHRDELDADLEKILSTRPSAHWLDAIAAAGVPVGPVNSLEDALAHPLTHERELIADVQGTPLVRLPFDQLRNFALSQPPALGAHTEEVLREVGYGPEDISAFVSHERDSE